MENIGLLAGLICATWTEMMEAFPVLKESTTTCYEKTSFANTPCKRVNKVQKVFGMHVLQRVICCYFDSLILFPFHSLFCSLPFLLHLTFVNLLFESSCWVILWEVACSFKEETCVSFFEPTRGIMFELQKSWCCRVFPTGSRQHCWYSWIRKTDSACF